MDPIPERGPPRPFNSADCRDDKQPLTELDAMLISDQRRTISVNDHLAFRESLAGLPKRKLKDANRVIDLLNELERGDA